MSHVCMVFSSACCLGGKTISGRKSHCCCCRKGCSPCLRTSCHYKTNKKLALVEIFKEAVGYSQSWKWTAQRPCCQRTRNPLSQPYSGCVAYTLDCCDREAIDWTASSGGYNKATVQDVKWGAIEHYNENHPYNALGYLSPKEYRRQRGTLT